MHDLMVVAKSGDQSLKTWETKKNIKHVDMWISKALSMYMFLTNEGGDITALDENRH